MAALETGLKGGTHKDPPQDPWQSFQTAAAALNSHHKKNYEEIGWRRDWIMAMLVVLLALVIRGGAHVIFGGPPAGAP